MGVKGLSGLFCSRILSKYQLLSAMQVFRYCDVGNQLCSQRINLLSDELLMITCISVKRSYSSGYLTMGAWTLQLCFIAPSFFAEDKIIC